MKDSKSLCNRSGSSCNMSPTVFAFWDIKQALQTDFLPGLFGNDLTHDILVQLACLPVKKAGLAILNPTASADSNWTASTLICEHLIVAIQGT